MKKDRQKPVKAGVIVEPLRGSEEDRVNLRCKIVNAPKPPKKWEIRYLTGNKVGKTKLVSKAHLKKHYRVV